MAIGERIHFFRILRGMTQKYLGLQVGFPEKSADVRLAQYETGARTPKAELTASLAHVLGAPHRHCLCRILTLTPDCYTLLFALEDNYGLKVGEVNGEICLRVNVRQSKDAAQLHKMLCAWQEQAGKLRTGEITRGI